MNLAQRILKSLFPPPKQRLTWTDALPLGVFLTLFLGVCIYLESSHVLLFARPAAFGLMVFTVWIWWMHLAGYAGLGFTRSLIALELRLILAGLFVALLAEPRAVRTSEDLSVIYAIDVSDSISEGSTGKALEFLAKTASKKPENDQVGLVIFGKNAAVEFKADRRIPLEDNNLPIYSLIDKEATNISQALALSAAMLPEDNQGRIVLISDGMQTEGDLSKILGDLKARGISVDVLPIQFNINEEVWLERLELPQFVKIGESYEAGIVLSSLSAGEGKLVIEENGEKIAEEPVKFQAGKNRYAFPLQLRSAGYYEYTARIEVPRDKDSIDKNNRVVNSLFLEGEGKVLLVTDPSGDDRDWKSIAQALKETKHAVEVRNAYEFPRDSASLLPYDCIAFVNAPADAFDQIQLNAMRDAVFNFGCGFIMVGGANSFGPGGYHRTVVEEALPVTMDISQKKVLPKGALVIILHTCEFAEGNTWAKRITKQAVKVLGAQDEVGVICFENGTEKWTVELTPAAEYDKIAVKIQAAEPGDMPTFTGTMQKGLAGLKKSDAATKHMIIISDGDPLPPPPTLIQEYIDNKISVSTVAIFPHGGNEIGLMRRVSEATGGRYYFPSDPNQLPSIFIKESKTLKRSMIQNKTITPNVVGEPGVLKGIEGLPPLTGYVITTAKGRPAETMLQVPEDQTEEDGDIDPILAITRYGLGKTAAFTSDLSPNWGGEWIGWDKYSAFVHQLFTEISRVQKAGKLRMWTYTSGNEGVVVVEDFSEQDSFLEIEARVSGPHDRSERLPLKQVGPRRYQASIPLWGKGRYHIVAAAAGEERKDERAFGGIIIPYSPEYLRFRSNPLILRDIEKGTGGIELSADSTADEIFNTDRQPKRSSKPIFDWILVLLACLIPLDVAIRRVQIDFGMIKSWLGMGPGKAVSTATMGALLERKQAVGSQIEARRGDTPLPTEALRKLTKPQSRPSGEQKPTPGPNVPPSPQQPRPDDPTTTTERLLHLKRKRQQDSS
ncbi:MAG: VWA domain-containing protein [Planctomycetes bacterium]|nr:VWA domain-containing protein [Planctomycetota bacterium]